MNLAEKIIFERKKVGFSQEQLAERLGITRQAVSKWEAGSTIPEISKLLALSEVFHVSIDYLVKGRVQSGSPCADDGCLAASGAAGQKAEPLCFSQIIQPEERLPALIRIH